MGFVRIFWKNKVQETYLPKISISGQIVFEILAQLRSDNSLQTLLNTLHAGVLKMPSVSNGFKDYCFLEVKCNRNWFFWVLFLLGVFGAFFIILKHNSITGYFSFKYSIVRNTSSALLKIQKWLAGRVILEIEWK